MLIAEPVQNAGGCLVPPDGYWPGLRELCDKYGIALVADEVITGFGRIGEWFASSRYGVAPDLITCAKGITSAYAPMGAVLVSDRIAEPLYEDGRMLMHGITFAGHPVAAAIALRNIEIFEREGVLENVRELEPYLGELLEGIKSRVPIVGDVRGAGFFWALELVRDASESRFSAEEREKLLRGFLAGRLLEEGLIARPDDRGDAVLHLAPPLISTREELEEMCAKTEAVLADASERFFEGVIHTAHGYWLAEAGAGRRLRRRWRATAPPTSSSSAAATPACGRRGSCARAARRWSCSRPSCAATGRAGATAASARRCGRICRRWSSASGASGRWSCAGASARERARRSARGATSRASTRGSPAPGYLMASTAPAHDAVIDDDRRRRAAQPRAGAGRRGAARALRLAALPPRAARARRRDRPARAARARPARAAAST